MSLRDITLDVKLKELEEKLKELGISEKEIQDVIKKIKEEELKVRSIRIADNCVIVSDTAIIKSLIFEKEWFTPLLGKMTEELVSEYQDEYGRTETFKVCTSTPVSVLYHSHYEENSGRVISNVKEVIILRKAQ